MKTDVDRNSAAPPCWDFWCCRCLVDCVGQWHTYAKRVSLPIAPSIGLGIIFSDGKAPEKITQMFVNHCGEIVCCFKEVDYSGDAGDYDHDAASAKWTEQVDYEFGSWEKLTYDCMGVLRLYRRGSV